MRTDDERLRADLRHALATGDQHQSVHATASLKISVSVGCS
jgi:hypothetical protein